MNQILFLNKYQPNYFNDFQTATEIIEILNTLIKMDNLNILFIGDIGSGKTTYLNATIQEYYRGYEQQVYQDNILHINSLKEQGINYYRNDVKIFCQTCSTIKNKKKIIILDDIDVINEQSQQVFRNCIDKYSHNVHFIASCSNSQKVIESLQSRLTIIKIKSLQKEELNQIMQKIIYAEKIPISKDAQEFILNVSNNNAKILINYMEKCKLLNREIDLQLATNVCTNISFFIFEEYTHFLRNNQLSSAIKLIYEIYDRGYSVMDILDNYFLFVKITNLLTETEKYEIIPIICKYITIFHNIHEDEIELSLFSNNLFSVFQPKK
jgi:DNA polymerase III delta prime subunit